MVRCIELYHPHEGQRAFHESNARFRVVACGRRYGKTTAAMHDMLSHALTRRNWRLSWVSPVMDQSARVFEEVAGAAARHKVLLKKSITDMRVALKNGSVMEFRSAHDPDHLRGVGLNYLVIDEAADVPENAWFACLRPALADRRGRAVFISTPKGRNWFHKLFLKGQDPHEADYASWRFSTWDNKLIDRAEEASAREIPEHVYRQEFEAAFLDDEDTVFRNVEDRVTSAREEPVAGEPYVFGLDLGRAHDFTVLIGLNARTRRMVAIDRFRSLGYGTQKERIANVVRRYNARLVMDSTGVGEPIFDDLRRAELDVAPYRFTEDSKRRLVENLIVEMEAGRVALLNDRALVAELQGFRYFINHSGRFAYEAPAGGYDDCVMALALAVWGLRRDHNRPAHVYADPGSPVFHPGPLRRIFSNLSRGAHCILPPALFTFALGPMTR